MAVNKLLGGIATIVALIVALAIGKGIGRAAVETTTPPDLDRVLTQTASNINATLPMMIDKDTRLDTTVGGPGKKFTYFYTLPSYASTEVDAQAVHDATVPVVKKKVCSSADMRPVFQKGVVAHYVYRGNDGIEVMRFVISPEDCGVSP